jgi:hypothetical protein
LVVTNAGPVSVRVVETEELAVAVVLEVVVELELGGALVVVVVVELVLVDVDREADAAAVTVRVTVTVFAAPPQPASAIAAMGIRINGGSFTSVPVRNPRDQRLSSGRTGARAMAVEQRRSERRCSTHRRRSYAAPALAVVTISSAYGALGTEVGHAVAAALDAPFLDRAIPAEVASRLAVPLEEAQSRDEALAGFLDRLLSSFVIMGSVYGGAVPPPGGVVDEEAFRAATEATIRKHAASGSAVILGRAGMLVLAEHPHVLRVRLSGPVDARIEQAVARYGLTVDEARSQQRDNDGARAAWVARYYGRDVADPSLYDLVLNATKFGVDECAQLIVAAVRGV